MATIDRNIIKNHSDEFLLGGYLPLILHDDASINNEQIQKLFEDMSSLHFKRNTDQWYMFIALLTAHRNIKAASPNPCVGAVYVKNDKIIATGYTQEYGGLHAETHAGSKLNESELKGSSVYVILEPCSHQGKQPPCADFLIKSQVKQVYVSCIDEDELVDGKGLQALKSNNITVKTLILEKQSKKLLSIFLQNRASKKIVFAGKWAQSIDGCLADDNGDSKWISNSKSRRYTHWLRYKYDAIMVGAQTAIYDRPSLDIRENFIINDSRNNPLRVVVDPSGKIINHDDVESIISKLKGKDGKFIILLGKNITPTKKAQEILNQYPGYFQQSLDRDKLISSIEKSLNSVEIEKIMGKKIMSCLVEGGPKLHSLFLSSDRYDFCHIFIAPIFLGGSNNIIQNLGNFPARITEKLQHHTCVSANLDGDILVETSKNRAS